MIVESVILLTVDLYIIVLNLMNHAVSLIKYVLVFVALSVLTLILYYPHHFVHKNMEKMILLIFSNEIKSQPYADNDYASDMNMNFE